jgi:hypothetical protein
VTELQPVAWEAVATELAVMRSGAAKELGWEPELDRATANAALAYARFAQNDCAGAERATGRVHVLGSGNAAEARSLACYRGFDISGDNRLAITAVDDVEATTEIVERVLRAPYVRHELAPRFATPPVTVEASPACCARRLHSSSRRIRNE